ncbi:gluconokinase [Bauldia sp.]|uniref:gluconokinase n=1 Tax=Bauldia sp. TaxID=2575872 RepID=UPI003BA9EAAA
MSDQDTPAAIVVMGVSGSGKTVVGEALAEQFGWRLLEADDFHPQANVDKMASGIPLGDADRWPWLDAIGTAIRDTDGGVIATCSALRRVYRERLAEAAGRPITFLFLDGARETLASRIGGRTGHFMPASLLDSQFATLEPPDADEPAIRLSVEPPVATVVANARDALAARGLIPEPTKNA